MSELISNIINSQIFAPLVIVWLVICVANQNARKLFLNRLSILLSKPIIFKEDDYPTEYALYPRRILEQTSMMFQKALTHPLDVIIEQFKLWIKLQTNLASRPEASTRVVGYFIYLGMFILFAWANAISIINSLDILGLYVEQIPAFLTSFEVAVFMGTLGTVVVAGLVLMDTQRSNSVLSNWDEHGMYWKNAARMTSIIVIVSAVMIVMALGLQRLFITGVSVQNDSLRLFTNFAILALVPINNVLSIVLISYEAILGILVVLVAIQMPLLGIMYVINFISTVLGTLLPFLFDLLYRFILLVLDFLSYVIITPIDTIIGEPIRWIGQSTKKE